MDEIIAQQIQDLQSEIIRELHAGGTIEEQRARIEELLARRGPIPGVSASVRPITEEDRRRGYVQIDLNISLKPR